MRKAGICVCSFICRLVEETCDSEKVGKQSQAMWWESLPGGGHKGRVPCHGHMLGSLREQRGQAARVRQGEAGRDSGTGAEGRAGRSSPADKEGRAFQGEEVTCVGSGGMREDKWGT